jgi:RepB DNA-primase from phage plasmid
MTLPNAAQQFLKLLDPAAEQFTFQTFQDRPQGAAITNPKLARVHQGADLLQRYYRNGAGVWVTVNETDGRGRRSENIVRIRCIFQEADAGYGGPFPLEPSITIETSPQRFHRYWLTSWGADAQGRRDFAAVMERMVASYGSCKGAKDISRVLRVPGFLHRKSTPHLVQIVSAPGHRYSREQILRAFPPIPHVVRTAPLRRDGARVTQDVADAKLAGIIRTIAQAREGERNCITFWGACRLAEMVADGLLNHAEALSIVVEAASRAGLSCSEALQTAQSAFRSIA